MGLFKKPAKPSAKKTTKKASTSSSKGAKSADAKAVLARMQAKKDAGDCPFC